MKQIVTRVAVTALLLTGLLPVWAAPEPGTHIDFELPDLDGQVHRLGDWRGQWVLVNYWATWCKPCRKEIPDFSALDERREDLTVLGLAFEDTSDEDLKAFLEAHPASYPILKVDVYDPPEALGAPMALPTSYLIDPEGRLVQRWIGPVTSGQVEARIAAETTQ
ncbi:MAG: hypothetical protein Kow0020_05020 [Wenzhouxiangellaceae bacterium]